MTVRTVPFDISLFYHAMIALLGRDPDVKQLLGWDGFYKFRYDPKSAHEKEKFANAVAMLHKWLGLFELTPLRSRCEYGRLLHPQKGEEKKDYLDIVIVHPVEKKEEH